MRYYYRVFTWQNGQKKEEYTNKCLAPIFYEENLDETLDTGEVILEAMPVDTKDLFPPKTKFRIERYVTKDYADTPKKIDLIVEHDDVEFFTGAPNICTHHISLIEASVIAQGMHVDNIALTYELQDVDLNYKTTNTSDNDADTRISPAQGASPLVRVSESFYYPPR